jgi:hypothetical protein
MEPEEQTPQEEPKEKPKKEFNSDEVDKKKYDDYFGQPPV